jgi:hypothetical protein
MVKQIIRIFFISMLFAGTFSLVKITKAAVIFEDNFDNQVDWTILQPMSGATMCNNEPCLSNDAPPVGWTGYLTGMSYCLGGPGYNTMYINNMPGYPNSIFTGTGRVLTFWDESCVNFFEDSDAQLSKSFNQESEVYISFKIKFPENYQWEAADINAHKLLHLRYWDGVDSPFANFNKPGNVPIVIPGIKVDHDLGYPRLWYYAAFRCENNYYCQGSPKYNFDVGNDQDAVIIGNWSNTLGDGNWHQLKFYFKMNTNNGAVFNADGQHKFWVDGNLIYDVENIPFSDNGSVLDPRREWNWLSIGGNNSNRWTTSCVGTECEQWYAIDDVVVSSTDIPINYVIGQNSCGNSTCDNNETCNSCASDCGVCADVTPPDVPNGVSVE